MDRRLDRWLARAHGSEPAALVLGSSINGLSFARSLGRRDVPVLLLDAEKLAGAHTRYAEFIALPPVEEEPGAWLDLLGRVAEQLSRPPVVFASADEYVVFLATHEELLASELRFLVPTAELIERIVNKRLQYRAAREAGIPIPKTEFPSGMEELEAVADGMEYPCILKPYRAHVGRRSIEGKKVVVLESRKDLVQSFESLVGSGADFMVQEIVPGGDTSLYGYLGFWDQHGRERSWLTKRKLRQNPPLFGDGSRQVTVDAPEVAELSRRLLSSLDYRGFVGIEFKHDRRDDSFRLMEVNPRTVSGNQMAISAGVDFPWLGYRHLRGSNRETPGGDGFRPGVHYVNEIWDLKAFLALREQQGLGFLEWMKSVYEAEAKALWATDDPRPLLVEVARGASAAGRKALRTFGVRNRR